MAVCPGSFRRSAEAGRSIHFAKGAGFRGDSTGGHATITREDKRTGGLG